VGESSSVADYLNPGLSIRPARFREHVRLLRRKFHLALPEEIPELATRKKNVDRLSVMITFDDGYQDNKDNAVSILLEEKAAAIFFVTTGPLTSGRGLWGCELWRLMNRLPEGSLEVTPFASEVLSADIQRRGPVRRKLTRWLASLPAPDRESALDLLAERAGIPRGEGLGSTFLTSEHLRDMRGVGMNIGAHTRSHPNLDVLEPEQRHEEINGSREDLTLLLGEPVVDFAYPNPGGRCKVSRAVRDSVARAGFRAAYTSTTAPVVPAMDLLDLPRIGVYAGEQEAFLFSHLDRIGGRAE
jgi:peptidoglycan/xylan/chitin deacetylase (PgdA/CDA1 family)